MWTHFNFEARRHDPGDKPLLLFAEVYMTEENYYLSTLSLVKSADTSNRCQGCWSNISHPPYRFRAGFDSSVDASNPEILSNEVAAELSENALQDYNEKTGTNLKFTRAMQCNRFTCDGLLMDFTRKNTSWVHMNFESRVGPKEDVLRLFGELYLGDDGNYVLATLSATEPKHISPQLKMKMKLEIGCPYCPADIYHPWRGFRYGFNFLPARDPPKLTLAVES